MREPGTRFGTLVFLNDRTCFTSVDPVKRLKEFYHKYKDYGLVDGLMYLSFFLFLAILFIFFRD
ncbi:hypothetical protein EFB08_10815 [Rufibacter latericius]|uniref:Uncharacterized protein n=1 Tax=Rufibacter latericius TaxID=2487040 RepID=A0A3M9MN74_9BACT|nr:hypothetical protein EFB08_10815 [Rufibacter latericius]